MSESEREAVAQRLERQLEFLEELLASDQEAEEVAEPPRVPRWKFWRRDA